MSTENFTLYTAKICPWAQRVEIALAETDLKFTRFEIDLQNKPKWYPKVNPATKVPAVAYGGPAVAPDQPSPESAKIAESAVLLDFVADLRPALLPSDPVARAQTRFVMNTISTKVLPPILEFLIHGTASLESILPGFEELQALLPAEGFVAGQWSIADASLAPFVGRLEALARLGVGKFTPEVGQKVHAELFQSAKFARLQKYWQDVSSRESWKKTWDEDFIVARRRDQLARG